eukprot:10447813-Prorocentrum_lima.AAC.1
MQSLGKYSGYSAPMVKVLDGLEPVVTMVHPSFLLQHRHQLKTLEKAAWLFRHAGAAELSQAGVTPERSE